jgi:2,4-dienoyl-CoA reductase-like NADH-dependent reductase (Old Yellow Enzyme family)
MSNNLFSQSLIGNLTLRNRTIRAGCFEGMSPGGLVSQRLVGHHRALAAGGIAMTTVAYCGVSNDGRAFDTELWMRPEVMPGLRQLTDAVHAEGAAASVQLVHCGFFASPGVIGMRPIGASVKYCAFRNSRCREMTGSDIEEKVNAFVAAAIMARDAGFDAVEIHAGHGYLLSQFLSPWTNRRRDSFGGSLENRRRFPTMVIRRVREALGPGYPILVKMNTSDGFTGGLQIEEAAETAGAFESAGASAIVPSIGFTARTPFAMLRGRVPVLEMAANEKNLFTRLALLLFGKVMVQYYPFGPMFLLDVSRRIREAVKIPVIYVGGAVSRAEMEQALGEGFAFIQIGRATIRHSDFVNLLKAGTLTESDCDHCNRCVAAMDGGGVWCVSEKLGLMKDWAH